MINKTITRRQQEPLVELPHLPSVLQRVYGARGVTSAADLERGLDHLLPFQALMGIERGAQCLADALQHDESILIVGDFDTDGATSCAVAVSALRALGCKQVDYLVPNRFEFGYGLTPEIVEVALKKNPALIVTVDNGISSCEGVAFAKSKGIKVVITDHHLAGSELPQADALINPNQPNDTFPSKNLAGVGVIFYVMLALRHALRQREWFKTHPEPNMAQLLDLVALGTVADVVPLDKNNRILVHQGLLRIRQGKSRSGIEALLNVGHRKQESLVAGDLGFVVAPRLNAAGRLQDMSLGIECLLAQDYAVAHNIAQQLDHLNQERRVIEAEMQTQAFQALKELHLDKPEELPLGFCLFSESWHQGVIGILASRVKDRLHRPVIAFAPSNEAEIKGSARSIAGLHIRDVLDAVAKRHPELIYKFGGHAMAAGVTLKRENYKRFSFAFDEEVRRCLTEESLKMTLYTDGELSGEELNLVLAEHIRAGGPWGQAFPEPIFDGRFKLIQQRLLAGKHLKLMLSDEIGNVRDGIVFNVNTQKWPNYRAEYVRLAYRLDVNEFRGARNVQLIIEHLEVCATNKECPSAAHLCEKI